MTYTFKLSRRLAISRVFSVLPVLLVSAACSGNDATGPEGSPPDSPAAGTEWRPRDIVPVAVRVNPSSVTLETNQLIHFRAHGRNSAGDSVGAAITWSTTGGTILPDGRFSAAATGTYAVIGTNRVRGEVQVDTSHVVVVRRQHKLASLEVSPTSTSLTPGVSQKFVAVGRLHNGNAVLIGVNWSARGGSIDAGGTYVAGDTAGTYQVVATNTAGTLADTATVTITAPPAPPPPDPAPPSEPTLASVTLLPSSVTLASGATKQFRVYGRTTAGDSVAVSAVFTATGGTVTSNGLYTAGSTAGSYRVIATSGGRADTSAVTITVPLGSGSPTGIPYGPWAAWDGTSLKPNTEVFTASTGSVNADNILARIEAARSKRVKLIIAMTGGAHENYMSIIDGVHKFDINKWKAKMNTFNTAAIKTAVAAAIADGTIIGNSVMDEPHVAGGGVDGNTWGPSGTMTKIVVDQLCGYVKSIFPTLPAGVVHRHDIFEPNNSYRVCDFLVSQYSYRLGSVTAYRDGGLAMAQRDRIAIAFSINIINGGTEDRDGTWDCDGAGSNGVGKKEPKCRMTAEQVRNFGLVLGPVGCAFSMWQYDSDFMSRPDNQQAFKDVAARLATAPARSCRRS
jgi:hypothetical protein